MASIHRRRHGRSPRTPRARPTAFVPPRRSGGGVRDRRRALERVRRARAARAAPPGRGRRRPRGDRGRSVAPRPGRPHCIERESDPDYLPAMRGSEVHRDVRGAHPRQEVFVRDVGVQRHTRPQAARTHHRLRRTPDPAADEREVDVLGQVHHRLEDGVDQLGGVLVAEHATSVRIPIDSSDPRIARARPRPCGRPAPSR